MIGLSISSAELERDDDDSLVDELNDVLGVIDEMSSVGVILDVDD